MGGISAHSPDIFGFSNFLVTREIVDFRQNFGFLSCEKGPRYSCQNFIPDGPLGSPYSAHENLNPSPKIFEKLGKNFFRVGHPGGLGPKFKGPPSNAWGRLYRVNRYKKGKTNLDFTGVRDSEWQWNPLGHAHRMSAPCSRQITTPAPHHSVMSCKFTKF